MTKTTFPIDINFRGLAPSEALTTEIERRGEDLGKFFDNIIRVRVTLEEKHQHSHQGNLFHTRIELSIPGENIFVGREPHEHQAHEDAYVSVRDAFDAAKRRLEDRIRRVRGKVKTHEAMNMVGKVVHVSPYEDYGFVRTSLGLDVYFHRNSLLEGRLEEIDVGDELSFVFHEGEDAKGAHASSVKKVG